MLIELLRDPFCGLRVIPEIARLGLGGQRGDFAFMMREVKDAPEGP